MFDFDYKKLDLDHDMVPDYLDDERDPFYSEAEARGIDPDDYASADDLLQAIADYDVAKAFGLDPDLDGDVSLNDIDSLDDLDSLDDDDSDGIDDGFGDFGGGFGDGENDL